MVPFIICVYAVVALLVWTWAFWWEGSDFIQALALAIGWGAIALFMIAVYAYNDWRPKFVAYIKKYKISL